MPKFSASGARDLRCIFRLFYLNICNEYSWARFSAQCEVFRYSIWRISRARIVQESDWRTFSQFYVKKDLIMLLLSPYTESFALETPQKVPPMYVNTNAVSIIYAWVSPGPERTAGNRSPGQFFMSSPKRAIQINYEYFSLLVLESSLSLRDIRGI